MDVATKIIERLGGHQAVADLLGCHITRVYRWTYPVDRGGTGGHIPLKQQHKLLAKAPDKIRPADFFPKQPKRGKAA